MESQASRTGLSRLVSVPFLAALALVLASALAVVVMADRSREEPGGTTIDPLGEKLKVGEDRVPSLSPQQLDDARKTVLADPLVSKLLEGLDVTNIETGVWHQSTGELLGASLYIELKVPTKVTGKWVTWDLRGVDPTNNMFFWPPRLTYTATYEGVDAISVDLRLPENEVAKIEVHGPRAKLVGTPPPELIGQPAYPAGGDQ